MSNSSEHGVLAVEETGAGVLVMMSFFSVIGTFGNALTLYVFSRMLRQNHTSTIFILTLAGSDLLTCVMIIPSTIVMEYLQFAMSSDAWCKIYHGLITMTVPYSAFIMMAITVDRYLCICHPFSHVMTIKRAKLTAFSIALLAISLGTVTSLFYGTYKQQTRNVTIHTAFNSAQLSGNASVARIHYDNVHIGDIRQAGGLVPVSLASGEHYQYEETYLKNSGVCDRSVLIVGIGFQKFFQWSFSSLFLIVIVVVVVLYTFIYRRVLQRRKSHPHIFASYWCFCIPKGDNSSSHDNSEKENGIEMVNERKSLRSPSMRSPNTRADKIFLVNLKIAITLCIVTVVYIVVYLPAWLMALKQIPENVMVFYFYLFHNVVNPFIYAFMNQNFREELTEIIRCKSQFRASLV